MNALQREYLDRDPNRRISIFAKAHLGHSPKLFDLGLCDSKDARTDLASQVESVIELYDAVKRSIADGRQDNKAGTEVILIGHSVGAWIALQVSKS